MEKVLLRESIILDGTIIKPSTSLQEKNQIFLIEGKERKCHGAYLVDVSRYDFLNENKRNYPKKLWENVINNQVATWSGGIGLADHPKDEGSVKDIFCVWDNLQLSQENKTAKACMYLVGEKGKLAREVLDAGGKVELSSSGYGEIMEDGSTVNPETYEIERIADWVLEASQRVFAKASNEITQEENSKKVKENKNLNTNYTGNNKDNNDRENNRMKNPDKVMILSLKSRFKEIKKTENLKERIKELKENIAFFNEMENPDEYEDFYNEMNSYMGEIENEYDSMAMKGVEYDSMMPDQEMKMKEMEDEITSLKDMVGNLQSELSMSNTKLEMAYEEMDRSKSVYESIKNRYKNLLKEASSKVSSEDYIKLKEKYDKIVEDSNTIRVPIKDLLKETVEGSSIEDKDVNKNSKKVEESVKKDKEVEEQIQESEEDLKKKEQIREEIQKRRTMKEEKGKKPMSKELASKLSFRSEDISKTNLLSAKINVKDRIESYYEDLKESYGKAIEPYRDDILGCTALFEAQEKFFKIKKLIDSKDSTLSNDRKHIIESKSADVRKLSFEERKQNIDNHYKDQGLRTNIDIIKCKPDSNWL